MFLGESKTDYIFKTLRACLTDKSILRPQTKSPTFTDNKVFSPYFDRFKILQIDENSFIIITSLIELNLLAKTQVCLPI